MTRRRKIVLLLAAALLACAVAILYWLLKPEILAPRLLGFAGRSLGLEITDTGPAEYRLRGTPQLVVRGVTAREPGAAAPVLRAERVLISLPWSTLRARGRDLTATRLELDAPALDLAAFQAWQAKRPPSKAPLPTLTRGLRIVRGSVIGAGWKITGVNAELPWLAPNQPLRMHLTARYVGDGLQAPVDVHARLTQPGSGAGLGVAGKVSLETPGWKLPSQILLSGRLLTGTGLILQQAKLGANARYESGDTAVPFAIGLAGTLRFDEGATRLHPAALSLRGRDAMPTLDSSGAFVLDEMMRLQLRGAFAEWPAAWPALPPPLGQSASPLPFALTYDGASDLSAAITLRLQRDAARFDARFRLFEVMDWIDADAAGSPLPPITGTLQAPQLEISGAILEGVQLQIEDAALAEPTP